MKMAVLEPLGLQEAFLNGDDQTDGEFSLTGRFSLSCRDALKLAQLFLNKGVTLDKTGHSIQLFNKDFAYEVFTQTEENDKHGLLTWVHQPLEKNEMLPKESDVLFPSSVGVNTVWPRGEEVARTCSARQRRRSWR